jgi:hypothetical protein
MLESGSLNSREEKGAREEEPMINRTLNKKKVVLILVLST